MASWVSTPTPTQRIKSRLVSTADACRSGWGARHRCQGGHLLRPDRRQSQRTKDKQTGAGALGTALLQRGDLAPPTTGVPGRGWATGHPTGEGECLSCPPPLAVTGPSAPGGQKPWDAQGAGDRVAAPSAPRGGTGWPQTRAQGGGRGPGWDPPHLAGCTLSMACWSSLYSTWAVERLSTNLSTASLSLLYM